MCFVPFFSLHHLLQPKRFVCIRRSHFSSYTLDAIWFILRSESCLVAFLHEHLAPERRIIRIMYINSFFVLRPHTRYHQRGTYLKKFPDEETLWTNKQWRYYVRNLFKHWKPQQRKIQSRPWLTEMVLIPIIIQWIYAISIGNVLQKRFSNWMNFNRIELIRP